MKYLNDERSVSSYSRFSPVKSHWYRFYMKPGSGQTRYNRKSKPGRSAHMPVRSVKTRPLAAFSMKNQRYDFQIKF